MRLPVSLKIRANTSVFRGVGECSPHAHERHIAVPLQLVHCLRWEKRAELIEFGGLCSTKNNHKLHWKRFKADFRISPSSPPWFWKSENRKKRNRIGCSQK